MIARAPITELWLAGLLPGLMMAVIFSLYIYVRCRIQPELGPAMPKEERDQISLREKIVLLRAGILPIAVFAIMMTLFLTGTTSLTESSVVGALLSAIAAALSGKLTWRVLESCTRNTLLISCMFLWIILAALVFSSVYDGLGAVRAIENLLLNTFHLDPWGILILMLLSFVVMGTFLDDTAMLVIVAPLYVPLVRELGFDLVWFGILYTITCQIAYITPPFGYNLFLMRALAPPEITIVDIYRSIWPFMLLMIASITILMIFPQIVLWLPSLYTGRAL
jgi:tripartite ATP-independent transporter DctM subunit